MQPRPIFLFRRRWTLLFQAPFTLLMVACLAYSVLLIYAADNKLLTLIGSVGAFASFCIAGTLGRSAWEAYREREPAVVIDESGITDLRDEDSHTVPWEAMERVLLDISENTIRVKLRSDSTASALGVIVKALQRWQRGGDVVFLLGGLAYDASGADGPARPPRRRGATEVRTAVDRCATRLCSVVARGVLWCNPAGTHL